jgi:hypothetical protein
VTTNGRLTCGDSGGKTQSGAPCGATLGLGEESGLCVVHDPERATQSMLDRREGGRLSGIVRSLERERRATTRPENLPTFPPDNLERLAAWHIWAANAVATGEIAARTGDTIARLLKELRPVLLNLDLEKKVKQLEQALKRAQRELEGRHG